MATDIKYTLNAQLAENLSSLWAESLLWDGGTYAPGAVEPQDASFGKMAVITLLSPFVSLVRFLI